jgi:putative ABC transport system substrate-binding protein
VPPRRRTRTIAAFREGLAAAGYREGRNLAIELRWAEGRVERLPALATELARMPVDVLVIDGMPAALAAKDATRTIPIVMAGIGDPVATGLVATFTRPGANMTGMTIMAAELSGKRLAVLRELLPGATRFSVLTNPDNAAHVALGRETLEAAKSMGISLHVAQARTDADIPAAFAAMAAHRSEGFVVLPDQVLSSHRGVIVRAAAQARLPALYERKETVIEGGLISYGVDYQEMYRRAAGFIDRILRGSKPGDLSIEQPRQFELVINAKTARELGIAITRGAAVARRPHRRVKRKRQPEGCRFPALGSSGLSRSDGSGPPACPWGRPSSRTRPSGSP